MEGSPSPDSPDHAPRVRVPWYPTYREVRGLLRVWPGRSKTDITQLRTTIMGLVGNPGDPVDWRDPDAWIPKRLSGDQRELALAIWTGSGKTANPRYTGGSWSLVRHYELIEEDSHGNLQLTNRGRDFLNHPLGAARVVSRHAGRLDRAAHHRRRQRAGSGSGLQGGVDRIPQAGAFGVPCTREHPRHPAAPAEQPPRPRSDRS